MREGKENINFKNHHIKTHMVEGLFLLTKNIFDRRRKGLESVRASRSVHFKFYYTDWYHKSNKLFKNHTLYTYLFVLFHRWHAAKEAAINHPVSCPALFLSYFSHAFQLHLPPWHLYMSVCWNSQPPSLGFLSHLASTSVSLFRKARHNASCPHAHVNMHIVWKRGRQCWTISVFHKSPLVYRNFQTVRFYGASFPDAT